MSIFQNSKDFHIFQNNLKKNCSIEMEKVSPFFLIHKRSGFSLDLLRNKIASIPQRVGFKIVAGPFPGRRLGHELSFAPYHCPEEVKITLTKKKPKFEKEDVHYIEYNLTLNGKSYGQQIILHFNYIIENFRYKFSLAFICSKDFIFINEIGQKEKKRFKKQKKKDTDETSNKRQLDESNGKEDKSRLENSLKKMKQEEQIDEIETFLIFKNEEDPKLVVETSQLLKIENNKEIINLWE